MAISYSLWNTEAKVDWGEFYPTCHDKVNEREVKTITGKFQVRVIPWKQSGWIRLLCSRRVNFHYYCIWIGVVKNGLNVRRDSDYDDVTIECYGVCVRVCGAIVRWTVPRMKNITAMRYHCVTAKTACGILQPSILTGTGNYSGVWRRQAEARSGSL